MKELKKLSGVQILSNDEKKNIIGGDIPQTLCYCPKTDILVGIVYDGDCSGLIDQKCPADA